MTARPARRLLPRGAPSPATTATWVNEAIRKVEADSNRSADTHLHVFPLPADWDVDLYLKDESVHPTGSLKHRLARSLFLYALCNGWIHEGTTVIEASVGLDRGLRGVLRPAARAAVRRGDAGARRRAEKIELIEFYGGRCHLVDDPGHDVRRGAAARRRDRRPLHGPVHLRRAGDRLARATTTSPSRSSSSSPRSGTRCPTWVVVGAGTGGTSATIGRFVRYRRHDTQVCVVDPENSAFFDGWSTDDRDVTHRPPARGSRGSAGRGSSRRSCPTVVDAMIAVPDAASIAAMRWCSARDRPAGRRLDRHRAVGRAAAGRVDARGGPSRAASSRCSATAASATPRTYYDDAWLAAQGIDIAPYTATLEGFYETGTWSEPVSLGWAPSGLGHTVAADRRGYPTLLPDPRRPMSLPTPRGPISAAVLDAVSGRGVLDVPDLVARVGESQGDVLLDDDLQLALWVMYELHYGGLRGCRRRPGSGHPDLLRVRAAVEARFEATLRRAHRRRRGGRARRAGGRRRPRIFAQAEASDGPPLTRFLQREATAEQFREVLVHRSVYQLKEGDPHTFVVPRVHGSAKVALVELQFDEYGAGRPERQHAHALRRRGWRSAGSTVR